MQFMIFENLYEYNIHRISPIIFVFIVLAVAAQSEWDILILEEYRDARDQLGSMNIIMNSLKCIYS